MRQDKIAGSERRSHCAGLRVKIESLGSNPEAGCQESANQKMSISSLRRENGFSQQRRDENKPGWRGEQSFTCPTCTKSLWIHLTLMCKSVLSIHSHFTSFYVLKSTKGWAKRRMHEYVCLFKPTHEPMNWNMSSALSVVSEMGMISDMNLSFVSLKFRSLVITSILIGHVLDKETVCLLFLGHTMSWWLVLLPHSNDLTGWLGLKPRAFQQV